MCGPAAGALVVLSRVLAACAPQEATRTIEVEVPVQVERTVEVPVEARVEVPIEVVVTATPVPPPPDAITEFEDVPEDVLVQVCEDVKQAVQHDDEARIHTIRLAAPSGPFMQLLSNGWASPLDMEWTIEQGDWGGDCTTWVQHHDPMVGESRIFEVENGTGPFRLEYWLYGEEISAVRWDDCWRTEPM